MDKIVFTDMSDIERLHNADIPVYIAHQQNSNQSKTNASYVHRCFPKHKLEYLGYFKRRNGCSNTNKPEDNILEKSLPLCSSAERLKHVRAHQCSRRTKYSHDKIHQLIVNDQRKVAYCNVAKLASSTLKSLMAFSTLPRGTEAYRIENVHKPEVLKGFGLRFVNVTQYEEILDYHKIVVLRNPFTRLVSAYNNKIILRNRDHRKFRRKVMQCRNELYPSRKHSMTVTFVEFIDCVLSQVMNGHWAPVNDMCNMCQIDYDSVLRLESFGHDIKTVIDVLGLNTSLFSDFSRNRRRKELVVESHVKSPETGIVRSETDIIPTEMDSMRPETDIMQPETDILRPEIETMRPEVLPEFREISEMKIRRLFELYKSDFFDFGYGFDMKHRAATCEIMGESGACC